MINTLDMVKMDFADAWEYGETGAAERLAAENPKFAAEITEYAREYIALEASLANTPERASVSVCPADSPNFGPRHIPGNVENSTAGNYGEGNAPINAEDWQKVEPWHLLCLVVADRDDTMDLWTTARRFAGTRRFTSEMEATRLRLRREGGAV